MATGNDRDADVMIPSNIRLEVRNTDKNAFNAVYTQNSS